ncbi:Bicyclomycin resistance protein [Pseudoruegeria aquimaris]|uniref:Bcr/CflA family efflux transporter n=2 Tax=Pseudoruegeria aquimaris TaxID=393663 RepID=A0A1Y5RG91_9RHOB|nr:Bicyclomycin resistance protein [Pseudoruegeria aquimaris]
MPRLAFDKHTLKLQWVYQQPEIAAPMTSRPTVRFLDRKTPPTIFTLILLAGISALSMNIFLPSLPNMTAHFDTEYRLMQLSVALYLGVNALLQVIVGPISDFLGRRPVILGSMALFCLFTLGCIIAPTVEIFLAFRMAQAVVVAGMVLSRAIVRDMVPQEEAASMIGYVTMGMSIIPMIGPAIGGVLDTAFGWQANFWLLLLCGLFVLWLTFTDLAETSTAKDAGFRRQFSEYPELLSSPRFWGYSLAAAFSSGSFFAYLGGTPFVGSDVFGLSPAVLGVYFGAPAIGYLAGNYCSGRFSVRFGINRMILWGTLFTAFGMGLSLVLFSAGLGSALVFFGFMTFVGIGNGLVLPNATSGMLSVRPHIAGTASGLGGAIMIGGGAALSALAGALLSPGSGALPLLWIMFATSVMAVACTLYVMRRSQQVIA